jgi:hypothetical protein
MTRSRASTSSSRKPRSNKARGLRPAIKTRAARVAAALAALVLLATFAPLSLFKPRADDPSTIIHFRPVALDADAPSRRRVGALTYLRGWVLTSANPRFGGISAMHVDGARVVAVNDAGWTIRFPIPDRAGAVRGLVEPLPQGPGRPGIKHQRDSESLAVVGSTAWIAYERQNAVWRYGIDDWRSDAHATPEAMQGWPKNSGSEGIVRLRPDRFLVVSEGAPAPGGTKRAVLFLGDPALAETGAVPLRYRPPEGYRLTDAAVLPDGRLLLLNRRFALLEGVSAKLAIAGMPRPETDALIEGRVIAELRRPDLVDNFEALSVTREGGRTIVWMASDDNFMPIQQTLLLKFALDETR